MREKLIICFIMIIVVPIAGEFKFFPLDGTLRVSLGTPVFFFFLLWSRKKHSAFLGLVAGISVCLFRIFLSTTFLENISFEAAFIEHFPAFFYYFIYGSLFQIFMVREHLDHPIRIGLLGTTMEIISTIIEVSFRVILGEDKITFYWLILMIIIAIIRSFFVVLLFNNLILYEVKKSERAQRKRNEKMLIHLSNLYVEMIQLKKSMHNTEQLTKYCYDLYRSLKNENGYNTLTKAALQIAGEVHDIKKDHQRIYAGLLNLIEREKMADYMKIQEIMNVIVCSNTSYMNLLERSITFSVKVKGEHPKYHACSLLSIINNLVANAVESIKETGNISIAVSRNNNDLIIEVSDDGPGISKKNQKLIFQPGFTTKFDSTGKASSGIGLTYVKDFIEQHGGTIQLVDEERSLFTTFILAIPIEQLNESEG